MKQVKFALVLVFAGCLLEVQTDPVIRLEPVPFFSGPTKRLESHLGFLDAVCFKTSDASSSKLDVTVELWESGAKVDHDAKKGILVTDQNEISLTLKSDQSVRNRTGFIITVGGARVFERTFQKPLNMKAGTMYFAPTSISAPITLTKDSPSAVLWAMGYGSGLDLKQQGEIEMQLKRQTWAIVFRVGLRLEAPPE